MAVEHTICEAVARGEKDGFWLRVRAMDTKPIEGAYCMLTLTWGIGLLLPGDGFGNSPSFAPMASIAPDWKWGLVAICIGLIRTVGVAGGHLPLRLIASMGGGIIWTFTALTMVGAYVNYGGPITGATVYGPLALINFGVFVKLCRSFGPLPRGARVADG